MDILADTFPKQEIAQKRLRVAAALVDVFIYGIIGFGVSILFGHTKNFYGESGGGVAVGFSLSGLPAVLMIVIWLLQFPLMEGLTGQTLGKKLFKLKVVKEDFSPTSVGTSFIRHLFDAIDLSFLVGLIIASSNTKKQRIGDLVARTVVIKS